MTVVIRVWRGDPDVGEPAEYLQNVIACRCTASAEGGYGRTTFTIAANNPLLGASNFLREGSWVEVEEDAQPRSEGRVRSITPKPGRSGTIEVIANGLLDEAARRGDLRRTYWDADPGHWLIYPQSNPQITIDKTGHLLFVVPKGTTVKGLASGGSLPIPQACAYYWLDSGLSNDELVGEEHIYDANCVDPWGFIRMDCMDNPWGSVLGTVIGPGIATGSGSGSTTFPAGTKALALYFYLNGGDGTAGADYWFDWHFTVKRQSAQPRIETIMEDLAVRTGLAESAVTESIGTDVSHYVLGYDQPTNVAAALKDAAALSDELSEWGFWSGRTFRAGPRATAPARPGLCLDTDNDTLGSLPSVAADDENDPQCIAVEYLCQGESPYPDGTRRRVYYPAPPATDADVCPSYAYTDVLMDATRAAGIAQRLYEQRAIAKGTVSLAAGSYPTMAGNTVKATEVVPGMWWRHRRMFDGVPQYIVATDINLLAGTNVLTIGEDPMPYRLPELRVPASAAAYVPPADSDTGDAA